MKHIFTYNRKKYTTLEGKVINATNKTAVIFSPGHDSIGYRGNRTDAFVVKQIIENGGLYVKPGTKQTLQVRFVPEKVRYTILDKNGYESVVFENEMKFVYA